MQCNLRCDLLLTLAYRGKGCKIKDVDQFESTIAPSGLSSICSVNKLASPFTSCARIAGPGTFWVHSPFLCVSASSCMSDVKSPRLWEKTCHSRYMLHMRSILGKYHKVFMDHSSRSPRSDSRLRGSEPLWYRDQKYC